MSHTSGNVEFGELGDCGGFGEADDLVVGLVHQQIDRNVSAAVGGIDEVAGSGSVGGADFVKCGAALFDHVGYTEATSDFDKFTPEIQLPLGQQQDQP